MDILESAKAARAAGSLGGRVRGSGRLSGGVDRDGGAADLAVVPTHLNVTATTTSRFFERRLSVMMRALGSPKIPRTVCSGRNPENEYVSQSRQLRIDGLAIHQWCQIPNQAVTQNPYVICRLVSPSNAKPPTRFHEDPFFNDPARVNFSCKSCFSFQLSTTDIPISAVC